MGLGKADSLEPKMMEFPIFGYQFRQISGVYPLVNKHSHGKTTILMVFTRTNEDFHGLC